MRHLFVLALLALFSVHAAADSTITYQGQLQDNGQPLDGQAELTFELFDDFDPEDPSVGNSVAGPISVNDVDVSDGLFQVDLDFGAVYEQPVWIEITVGTDTLHPRQRLTSTPVAVHALNVSSTAGAWMLGGNAGTDPANDFLGTTDNSPLELRVNDRAVTRIFDGTDVNGHHAPNLIVGSELNVLDESGDSVIGATIVGGGGIPAFSACGPNDSGLCVNTVSAEFATVVGGRGNYATGRNATAMGQYTTASGRTSTAMGRTTTASGTHATAMGRSTTASGRSSTAMGQSATAGADYATAIGRGTTASGNYATAMGRNTIAGGEFSLAAGRRAIARDAASAGETDTDGNCTADFAECGDEGTFVWADSTNADFTSTGPDQFLLRASGGVGIGTNAPRNQLDVVSNKSGSSANANHVMVVDNTATSQGNVLGLRTNATTPGAAENFITFKAASSNVGALEGDGSGGITLTSGSADFAEYLRVADGAADIRPADVVGVVGDTVSLQTSVADRAMVVSTRPIMTGNDPGLEAGDRDGHVPIAFLGQVPVRISGPVSAGDYVVPSGLEDGTGVGVPPGELSIDQLPQVVGRALEDAETEPDALVKTLVGQPQTAIMASVIERRDLRLDQLESRVAEQGQQLVGLHEINTELHQELERLSSRNAELRESVRSLVEVREQSRELKTRIAKLEAIMLEQSELAGP